MTQFLIIILLSVIILVSMVIKLKVHPTIALFIAAIFVGLGLGNGMNSTVTLFTDGFGATLGSIGCTVIFGSIIAQGIRDTNSVKSMVNFFIKCFRGKCLELSTALAAYVMSIPVFGDITQVLVAPIASTIARRNKKSMSTMAGYSILGCALTHAMVPPTPGILAVAVLLAADLGMVIFWGIVISFAAFMLTWLLTKNIVAKEWIEPREDYVAGMEEVDVSDYKNLLIKDANLPPVVLASAPILVPVILITLSSFADMLLPAEDSIRVLCNTIGNKNIALFIGVIISVLIGFMYNSAVKENHKNYFGKEENNVFTIMATSWVADALQVALIPLMVTAMGGGFSTIIKSYEGIPEIGDAIVGIGFPGFLVPFMVGAIMMIAVGSRTTAGMTGAAICAPMILTLGLSPVAAAVLIGAGTMVGSHVSDSGFWVGTALFNLDTKQGLKYITLLGTFCGFIALALCGIFVATGMM